MPYRALVLVAAALSGCAHAPLVCPHQGGPGWHELTSAHFQLRSDLPRDEARTALIEFERSHQALEELALRTPRPGRRIELVLFRREEDFREFAPEGAMGWFRPRQNNDVEYTPTIALHGRMRDHARRRLQHELVHRLLAYRIHRAPPWVEEGLAEYYSTLQLDGGEAILGQLPMKKLFTTEVHSPGTLHERWVEARVQLAEIPRLEDLVSADEGRFHDLPRESAYYAAAWVLVHLFHHGAADLGPRFRAYLDDLAAGLPHAAAWRRAFDEQATADLAARYQRYLLRLEMDVARLRYRAVEPAPPSAPRLLDDDEVHLLWARIRPWDSRENIVQAGADLKLVLARRPGAADTHYWWSLYEQLWRRYPEAERHLRVALERAPGSSRYLHALAALLYDRERARPAAERDLSRLSDLVSSLERLEPSPYALAFLARYYHDAGQPDRGLPFARRAVEAAPDCWECVETYGLLSRPPAAGP